MQYLIVESGILEFSDGIWNWKLLSYYLPFFLYRIGDRGSKTWEIHGSLGKENQSALTQGILYRETQVNQHSFRILGDDKSLLIDAERIPIPGNDC